MARQREEMAKRKLVEEAIEPEAGDEVERVRSGEASQRREGKMNKAKRKREGRRYGETEARKWRDL